MFLNIEYLMDNQQLSAVTSSRSPSEKSNQGFFYRLPVTARVSMEINKDIKVEEVYQIAQFGTVTYLPGTAAAVQFYPETGGVKNILME